jgi:hypothetical protein
VPGGRRVLHLTDAAEAVRRRVEERLYPLEQGNALGSGFKTAVGKLHGIWGRLALTLAHVTARRDAMVSEVDDRAAELAERLVFDSLIPNMVRFYQMLGGSGDVETIRAIAAFLLREQRLRITGRDIIQHVSSLHRSKVDQIREALSPLVNMGWLIPEGDNERLARGWQVNQAIYAQFPEQAMRERAQNVMVREMMNRTFADRRSEPTGEPAPNPGLEPELDPAESGDAENVYNVYRAGESDSSATPSLTENEGSEPTPPRARDKQHKHRLGPSREAVIANALNSRVYEE